MKFNIMTFVFPTYKEVFGLVNLEAMQWGLPIISSNEGAIPEVVLNGTTGYIVDPKDYAQIADHVLRLINDDQLRTRMGRAGREAYERSYTIESYEKRLQDGLKFFCGLILDSSAS